MLDFDWVLKLFYNRNSVEVCKSLYKRTVDVTNLSLDEKYRKKDYKYSLKTLNQYRADFQASVILSQKSTHVTFKGVYYPIAIQTHPASHPVII